MNLSLEPARPVTKSSQTGSKRTKPTQKQMGSISPRVRQEVRERSSGVCEVKVKCRGSQAYEMAHLIGRKQLKKRTTADDLKHACVECHRYLDTTAEGIQYKRTLYRRNK